MATPLGSEPLEVAVAQVESGLRRLWQQEASGAVFARALNLVVIQWDSGHAEAIRDAVARVTETHPARTIMVATGSEAVTPDDGPELRSWIACRCQPVEAGPRVCHEEIHLAVQGRALHHLDSILFSMLTSDVPRFLWWCGALPRTPDMQRLFGRLVEQCDRLMIDSRLMSEPDVDLVALSHLALFDGRPSALGDLNWHRLTLWRHLLAQTFDMPEVRSLVDGVQQARIAWRSDATVVPVQVLLYIGWLASGLGWSLDGTGAEECRFSQGGRTLSLRLERVGAGDTALTEVEVSGASVAVHLRRVDDTIERVVSVPGYPRPTGVIAAPGLDLAAALESELAILTQNPTYERALHMAERLVRYV
jgi:glucose-6-phosphate dehydrogenase assembly protein OpcA